MKTAIEIVKNIVFPQLEKDSKFSPEKCDAVFWEKLTTGLLHIEEDTKSVYSSIYSLKLSDPEKVISKLFIFHSKFIKDLAESYVLGRSSETTEYLLKTDNAIFLKEIQFFQTLEQAIKKVERQRIKEDLPTSYDRLAFELSEDDIITVAKKQGREDLKAKFKQWDSELEVEDSLPVISMVTNEKEKTKVISLLWVKYVSIASIFIIGFMVWQPNKLSNDNLFAQYNSDESIIQSIDYQKMATVSESDGVRGGEILFQNYTKSETDEAMEAIELFKNNNFEKSKQMLITLKPREKNNQLLLFLAIAQLKTDEVHQAVSNLEYLSTIANYEFADEVKFHLALGYINQNEKRKAKDLLVTLVHTNNKYSNIAQEILDNMRWF